MQHFDNLDHYNEEDFDMYYDTPKNKRSYFDTDLKQYYFAYEDAWGEEYELFTTVECIWEVTPPDPTTWASDLDYHGYVELKSWEVISVEDHEGNEVKPEDVLTEKQLLAYTQGLEEFVES
jgi:hypothetical protein